MTTIATDGITIAADSLTTFGHERSLVPTKKLRVKDGYIFGSCGVSGVLEEVSDWYLMGHAPNDCPNIEGTHGWSLLVVEPSGETFHVNSESKRRIPVARMFAIGQGAEFALGAMLAGASAKEAVEIACKLSTRCGLPVQVIRIADVVESHLEARAALEMG